MSQYLRTESSTQIFSRFSVGLREDLHTELLARGITKLEKAYALVQDVDSVRTNHTFKSQDYRVSVSRASTSPQPNRFRTQTPSHKNDIKGKSLERVIKIRALSCSKLVPQPSATNVKIIDT